MFTLDRRKCQLGFKASAGAKDEADQDLKTLTLELADVPLEPRELNALLAEPHAWDVLFNANRSPPEPYLKSLKSLELKAASEHAYVALWFGEKSRHLIFTDVKISKIKLEPLTGGDTALSCKITAAPVLDGSLAELFAELGAAIECEIRAEVPHAQSDLPLNQYSAETPQREDDEGEDEDDAAEKPKPKPKRKMPPPKKRKGTNGHVRA